ncbi:hypothetical protein [Owenweeksia hongkongensis]|uniref:hypothetical protein n=1 Tax=Owenweeksia hongkongensis TaxID=253245 RepID=UPI003A8F9C24
MDANEFINLLKNPEKVEGKSVEELKKLAAEYPYSQPVQLLYAIRLSQSSEYLFNRQLGKTSILTDDRSVLFDLFEREADEAVEGNLELSLDEKLQKEFNIEERKLEKDETIFPKDPVEQKLVHPPKPVVAEPKPEVPPKVEIPISKEEEKPEPKSVTPKPDLSKLSPAERVKAILEENRRLREEFAGRKSGEPIPEPVKPVVEEKAPEPEIEERSIVEEPNAIVEPAQEKEAEVQEDVVEESIIEETSESVAETQEEEELEIPVFTIEEEKPEPVFEIGEDYFFNEEIEQEEILEETPEEVEDEIEVSFEQEIKSEAPEEKEDGFVKSAHSFGGWLKHLRDPIKKSEPEKTEQAEEKPSLDEKINLLDKFVEKLPELKQKARFQVKAEPPKEKINMNRLMDDNDDGSMVTETLARVYIKQKHYDKAIKAYEIMKLKYPEKSSFFADQISEIKKLSNSK